MSVVAAALSLLSRVVFVAVWIAAFVVAARLQGRTPRAATLVGAGAGVGLFGSAASALQGLLLPTALRSLGAEEVPVVYGVVSLVLSVIHATAVALLIAGAAEAGRMSAPPEPR